MLLHRQLPKITFSRGSIILFAALAAVMLATRRVDWYRLKPEEPTRTEASYR